MFLDTCNNAAKLEILHQHTCTVKPFPGSTWPPISRLHYNKNAPPSHGGAVSAVIHQVRLLKLILLAVAGTFSGHLQSRFRFRPLRVLHYHVVPSIFISPLISHIPSCIFVSARRAGDMKNDRIITTIDPKPAFFSMVIPLVDGMGRTYQRLV